jgi:hypothetical protein
MSLPEALLTEVTGPIYVRADDRTHLSSDYYYGSQEYAALEMDEPGVLETLNAAPWEVVMPGELERRVKANNKWFYTHRYFCQDCHREDFDMVMLKDALWERLYPKNGHACPRCMGVRLGREIQPSDCSSAPVNSMYWRRRMTGDPALPRWPKHMAWTQTTEFNKDKTRFRVVLTRDTDGAVVHSTFWGVDDGSAQEEAYRRARDFEKHEGTPRDSTEKE